MAFRRLFKFLFTVGTASLCLNDISPVFASEADSANTAEEYVTPLYSTGIASADGSTAELDIKKTTILDYDNSLLSETYEITNSSSNTVNVDVAALQLSTLSSANDSLYDFFLASSEGGSAKSDLKTYYSSIFSSSGVNESSFSLEELLTFSDRSYSLPDDSGSLFHLTRDDSTEAKECLSISLSNDNCHIYPIGCTYSSSEDAYKLSISSGFSECYVFLTGNEGEDFNLELTDSSGFELDSEKSSLDDFLSLCCDFFLQENSSETMTKELLMTDLGEYFGRSSVTVSLDLLPTLEWIAKQERFLIYDYSIEIPSGETAKATVSRKANLDPSGTTLYPKLTIDSSLSLDSDNFIQLIMPKQYSSAAIQQTESEKKIAADNSLTYAVTKYKGDAYKVVLFKTPMWASTTKYLPIFAVIMAIFMMLCFVSYISKRRRLTAIDNDTEQRN